MTLSAYYDAVVMEALKKALRDAEAGRLAPYRFAQIKATIEVFIETMEYVDDNEPTRISDGPESQPPSAAPTVLCVAARSKLDEAAAALLGQLLATQGLRAVVVTAADLAPGGAAGVDLTAIRIVCLSAFDVAEGRAQVKFLVRRLRRTMPSARFVGGFWRADLKDHADADLIGIATDDVVTTLVGAVERCSVHQQEMVTVADPAAVAMAHDLRP